MKYIKFNPTYINHLAPLPQLFPFMTSPGFSFFYIIRIFTKTVIISLFE